MATTPDSNSKSVSNLSLTLKVNEIFYSLQGESSRTGLPTVFVRLTGCPLRCHYCDTEYAFYNGKKKTISEILHEIKITPVEYVCVTGGEPLAQKYCKALLNQLCVRMLGCSRFLASFANASRIVSANGVGSRSRAVR